MLDSFEGSFGYTYEVSKKIASDKRFDAKLLTTKHKCELDIFYSLQDNKHKNCIWVEDFIFFKENGLNKVFVVRELVTCTTISGLISTFADLQRSFPMYYVKSYVYQLLGAVSHLHSLGYSHR